MAELQARISQFSPPPVATSTPSFQSALAGVLPADPGQFQITPNQATPPEQAALNAMADTAAAKYGLDPKVFHALVSTESNWNPSATSRVGATGLTQLMPATARALGVSDPTNPQESLEGGAKYLKQMLDEFGGDYGKALAAYNAGPGAVKRAGGIPPYQETVAYVRKILGQAGGTT
jgi:soluble lytic murein transglycosylase-like protein